jgi:hypothetical protein
MLKLSFNLIIYAYHGQNATRYILKIDLQTPVSHLTIKPLFSYPVCFFVYLVRSTIIFARLAKYQRHNTT